MYSKESSVTAGCSPQSQISRCTQICSSKLYPRTKALTKITQESSTSGLFVSPNLFNLETEFRNRNKSADLLDSGSTEDGSMSLSTIVFQRITANWCIFIRLKRTNFGALFLKKRTPNCMALTKLSKAERLAKRWKISRVVLRSCTRWTRHRQICSVYCWKLTRETR